MTPFAIVPALFGERPTITAEHSVLRRVAAPQERAIVISSEMPADAAAREALLDRAMGPGRRRKTSERLRAGRLPAIALVARAADPESGRPIGPLLGTVRLWHVSAGDRPALLLGPLAVAPERQSAGLGARLMREALARAGAQGHGAVLLVGDAGYYRRFGFSADLTTNLRLPGPYERERFLALELETGALAGAEGLVRATGRTLPLSSVLFPPPKDAAIAF